MSAVEDESPPPGRVDPGIILVAVCLTLALVAVVLYLSGR